MRRRIFGPRLESRGRDATIATTGGTGSVDALHGRIRDLEGENQRLTLRVQDLQQQLWGRKAERGLLPAATSALSLFEPVLAGEGAPVAADALTPRRRATTTAPRGPRPLDPALPREVIALPDPPPTTRRCPVTGIPLVAGFTEHLEVLARRPATYYVQRYERTVWVSPAKTAPLATPWPAGVLPRARMHASVIAHIAAAHYSEHLPFYRLEQQLARTGVTLARSTQVSLMTQLDALVAPWVTHLKTAVLSSGYVHLDATPRRPSTCAIPHARVGCARRRSGRIGRGAPIPRSRGWSGSTISPRSPRRIPARCCRTTAAGCRPMAPRGSTRSTRSAHRTG